MIPKHMSLSALEQQDIVLLKNDKRIILAWNINASGLQQKATIRMLKVRFLLAIIGFLRPSDVRVLRQCVVSVESEVLTLVAPYWPTVLWFPLLQSLVIQSLPFLAQEENLRTAYSNQELTATTEDLLRPPRLEDNVTNRSCK
ncbi:hypothetical protein BCV71DRAFT_236709 [Rhizopus microsporus]|uniref:Uncharacterized protein n=1 Tax=Rhizopus microsporus TaxID=58291 RepID=A0A1X0RWP0_RHIZD|nr:hypothetical protein BCV71DRAFT_236709 [Rhizopus microsporus]